MDDLTEAQYREALARILAEADGSRAESGTLAELVERIEALVRFERDHDVPEAERLSRRLRASQDLPASGRTGLVSDIHGNLAGLLVALDDIERAGCDRVVCLGDLVEGGDDDVGVVEEIERRGIRCVRGNHDEDNDVGLPPELQARLLAMPERIAEGEALYVHISPRAIKRKLDNPVEAWNVFDETPYRRILVGHVHVPLIFGERSDDYGMARRHTFRYGEPFAFEPDDRYIVCVGAVGYGRDHEGTIRYGILDHDRDTIEIRSVPGPVLRFDYSRR